MKEWACLPFQHPSHGRPIKLPFHFTFASSFFSQQYPPPATASQLTALSPAALRRIIDLALEELTHPPHHRLKDVDERPLYGATVALHKLFRLLRPLSACRTLRTLAITSALSSISLVTMLGLDGHDLPQRFVNHIDDVLRLPSGVLEADENALSTPPRLAIFREVYQPYVKEIRSLELHLNSEHPSEPCGMLEQEFHFITGRKYKIPAIRPDDRVREALGELRGLGERLPKLECFMLSINLIHGHWQEREFILKNAVRAVKGMNVTTKMLWIGKPQGFAQVETIFGGDREENALANE